MRSFITRHIEKTKVKPDLIWAIWEDVNNWHQWDNGLQSAKLLTRFETEGKFLLIPIGSPFPIEITLKEVIPHKKFIEHAPLPYGMIEVQNEMSRIEDETIIIHTVTAEIEDEHAETFLQKIWRDLEAGMPLSIKKAVAIAEKHHK